MGEVEKAAKQLLDVLKLHGEWDDGCFYYSRTAAPELVRPMQELEKTLKKPR